MGPDELAVFGKAIACNFSLQGQAILGDVLLACVSAFQGTGGRWFPSPNTYPPSVVRSAFGQTICFSSVSDLKLVLTTVMFFVNGSVGEEAAAKRGFTTADICFTEEENKEYAYIAPMEQPNLFKNNNESGIKGTGECIKFEL